MFARLRLVAAAVAALSYAGAAEAQAPVITSTSQHSGNPGSSVVLTGANLGSATAVKFGSGSTNAAFVVNLPTQITATVPVGASPGVITVTTPFGTAASPLPFYPGPVSATVVGPVFPPPQGHTFSMTGAPGDGNISRLGGKTFFVSNVPLANTRLVSFGPEPNGVRLSFKNQNHTDPGEILTYQPGLSNLPGGVAVWTGQTSFDSGLGVLTRFTMTATDSVTFQPVPLVAATDVGLAGTIGALHGILPGQSFSVNHRFEAFDGGTYVPALDVFNNYHGQKSTAWSSYSYGYYYDNTPPRLTVNTGLALAQGGTAAIPSAKLQAVDDDGPDSQITFTLAGGPFQGTLFKGATPLITGGTFTQQDIDNGLLSYTHNNSCNTVDNFQFSAVDAQGGVMSDAGFTVFSFNIAVTFNNLPPVPTNAPLSVGLGASANSTLTATNPDCIPPNYTFAIQTPPTKGTLSGFNPATGAFTYTATLGQVGADSFTFSVNDGVLGSVAPGTISVTIEDQAPVVTPQELTTQEDAAVGGTAAATDPDRPAQAMTWSIGTNGVKGTAVIGSSSGAFTYTPAAGRFGLDSFTVIANDGTLASTPATFAVDIRPKLLVGRVLVSNDDDGVVDNRLVLLVNPVNNDLGLVAQSGSFSGLRGVTHGPSGAVVVNSGDTSLYRVDGGVVLLGAVDPSAPFGPLGVTTEATGDFLVAQTGAGVGRYSASGSALTGYSGGFLQLATGVALATNGDIYVTDGGSMVGGTNKIVKIAPGSGTQTVIASGGALDVGGLPFGIVVDANGDLYVAHGIPGTPGGTVFKVTQAGAVTLVTNGGSLNAPVGVTFGAPNELIVANNGSTSIVKVDKSSGVQTPVYSGGPLRKPWGVRRIESLASRVAVSSINGGISPVVGVPFAVTLATRNAAGSPAAVALDTTVNVSFSGPAAIPSGSCTVLAGTDSCTVSGRMATAPAPYTATAAAPSYASDPAAPFTVTGGVPLQADLAITKTDGQTTAVPGQPVTYTIVASNAGPNAVLGATVADTVPAAITGATWTCAGAGGGSCAASGSVNINDTAVNLPVGGTVTYTLTGTISASATGNLSNTATVAVPAGVTDPNTANNSATDADSLPGVGNYYTVAPCRVVDTRGGAPNAGPVMQGQQTRVLAIAGNCGIPANAKAVSINIAVTQSTAGGNVRVFPAGQPVPTVSSINYSAGQTRGNNAIVALNASGQMAAFVGQAAGTTVHVIIDVNGYFN